MIPASSVPISTSALAAMCRRGRSIHSRRSDTTNAAAAIVMAIGSAIGIGAYFRVLLPRDRVWRSPQHQGPHSQHPDQRFLQTLRQRTTAGPLTGERLTGLRTLGGRALLGGLRPRGRPRQPLATACVKELPNRPPHYPLQNAGLSPFDERRHRRPRRVALLLRLRGAASKHPLCFPEG
jgi:hypothetical protein